MSSEPEGPQTISNNSYPTDPLQIECGDSLSLALLTGGVDILNRWGPLGSLAFSEIIIVQTQITCVDLPCTTKKYIIRDISGEEIYEALEERNCCRKMFCAHERGFRIVLRDFQMQEIVVERPFRLFCQELKVFCPSDNLLGSVKEKFYLFRPKYEILDAQGEIVFRIKGPCYIECCRNSDILNFRVLDQNGITEVGIITKLGTEDNFKIIFASDMDPRLKALWIGACILIDFVRNRNIILRAINRLMIL